MEVEARAPRERLLDPVDRVSEILFGLIMAVTIVGSLSIATAGREDVRTTLYAALGCNIAWGLVDAVMYLVRTLAERTRGRALARQVRGADTASAHRLIRLALPEHVIAVIGPAELEAMRTRLIDRAPEQRAVIEGRDWLAALGIFLLVVLATFPVAVPFLLIADAPGAMLASRIVTVGMLFAAGVVLGRHAGHARPMLTGAGMALLGVAIITIVKALGG